jgi:phosphoglycolate phosphatase-like HAD superfamily hydrolase
VPRRTKIVAILANILEVEVAEELVSGYLDRYDAALVHLLFVVPLVDGIAEFMARNGYTYYVCSSAPKQEVERQLARAGLTSHFTDVFGLDTPKAEALRHIKLSHAGTAIVFLGDSPGDQRAADAAGVPFIAVVAERDNFPGENVVKLKNFSSLDVVQESFREAFARHAVQSYSTSKSQVKLKTRQ